MQNRSAGFARHLADVRSLVTGIDGLCWVSGPTAAALHGFDGFDLRAPYHVLTLRGRNVHRVGHHVHTTTDLPRIDRAMVDEIPVLSPTRTLIDIAGTTDPTRLTVALDSALRDGLTSDDFLHRRISAIRKKGRPGVQRLLAVMEGAEIVRGGQSWLEREMLRLIAKAGLPRPSTQVVLARRRNQLIRVDFVFTGTPVVVEALGYRWHRTGAQLRLDTERMNELILRGFVPLQFTYAQVLEDPAGVTSAIGRALDQTT